MSEKFENDEKKVTDETSPEKVGQAMKKPSFWFDVLTTALGLFAGNLIISVANLNTLIENRILSFVVDLLILIATTLISKAVANAIKSLIKKK